MGTLYLPQEQSQDQHEHLLSTLPRIPGWRTPFLYFFQGYWCQAAEIQAVISTQNHFKARDSDVILATIPKSGTTWLKALIFAIVNRVKYRGNVKERHPLLTSNPHDLVPFLEYKVYAKNQTPNLTNLPSPRLFATHVPYHALPKSILESKCKIVYICRNPFDTFVSIWHFMGKVRPESLGSFTMEEAFKMYCKGQVGYGPYWDHMLGYWKESIENPDKVMFFKYEDMKEDVVSEVKRLARFLGFMFSPEEERDGMVDQIVKLCSFESLKEMEANKNGKSISELFENRSLFRKGEVGDWVNYLNKEMAEKLGNVMDEKLAGSGLQFKTTLL